MKINSKEFKKAFEAAFIVNRKHLSWNNKVRRTALMTAYIYRTISDCFPDVELEYEYRNIDAVLLASSEQHNWPHVAIEHENDVSTIGTELQHLLEVNAPLSVLITYTGNRRQWIIKPHLEILERFEPNSLLVIVNSEEGDWDPQNHQRGEPIQWDFFTYSAGALVPV